MAERTSKGSIILEIVIVLLALLLVAVILVPNQIWKQENRITEKCRDNMNALYEAEMFYYQGNDTFTDTLSQLLTYVENDSGLTHRQGLVSLTRSLIRVIDNILEIQTLQQINDISQAAFEITGDLVGNERYFRRHEGLLEESRVINRKILSLDSSMVIPNFSKTKNYIDSLQNLRNRMSDYPLQNSVLNSMTYVDSIKLYYSHIEMSAVNEYWEEQYARINNFISDIKQTDIVKVSSVGDRLKKFIDRINDAIKKLNLSDFEEAKQQLDSERQNLKELHQKFLSPDYFILTQKYGLASLNETDSTLISLSQNKFFCPDNEERYLIAMLGGQRITVECPNLLDQFHSWFNQSVAPIKGLPLFTQMNNLDTALAHTSERLNENRTLVRRYTDILLKLKELLVEIDEIENSSLFYRYTHNVQNFIDTLENETKLSVLEKQIEDVLNPLDTLAARIENKDISDLEERMNYFDGKLKDLDSTITNTRMPSRVRNKIQPNAETFTPVFDILENLKSSFQPSQAEAFRQTARELENSLKDAMDGIDISRHVIFSRTHINHGYIKEGEKSWELE